MKRLGWILFLLLLAVAYVAGYWPQHRKFRESEDKLNAASARLADAESRIRLCKLQNHLIGLVRKTADKNYGEAQALSTKFFDEVLAEARQTANQQSKSSLESILQQRDAVTAALAKGDSSSRDLLLPLEKTMHELVETNGL
jgi:hypothetical protein